MLRICLILLYLIAPALAYSEPEVRKIGMSGGYFYNKKSWFLDEYTDYKINPYDRLTEDSKGERERWSYELRLFFDTDLAKTKFGEFYLNQQVTGMSTTRQFRYVSWEFKLGQRLTDRFDIYYHHKSEHGLDIERNSYPMHDAIGISYCFGGSDCE